MKLVNLFAASAICITLLLSTPASALSVTKRNYLDHCQPITNTQVYKWRKVNRLHPRAVRWEEYGMDSIEVDGVVKTQPVKFKVNFDVDYKFSHNGGSAGVKMTLENHYNAVIEGSNQALKYSQFRYELVNKDANMPISNWWLESGKSCETQIQPPTDFKGSLSANVYEKI